MVERSDFVPGPRDTKDESRDLMDKQMFDDDPIPITRSAGITSTTSTPESVLRSRND